MMTKGKMIKALKEAGVRKQPGTSKQLEHLKTYEVINLYYESGLANKTTSEETNK